jgi:predicted kinase
MLAPAPRLTLLLFKGHPATGKSTLANALAQRLSWPLIDKDDIKDHLFLLPNTNSGQLSYEILWQIVNHLLALGLSVIADTPLSYQHLYAKGAQLATAHGARIMVVETRLAEQPWRARLEARLDQPITHRTTGWDAMQRLLAEYDGSWHYPVAPEHHLIVDTSLPISQLVQTIEDFLKIRA